MDKQTGWKPIPLPLKILFVAFVLWSTGSLFAIPARYELGLPFFGVFVYGIAASLIVLLLDIVGPITFLFALWNRKYWGPSFAFSYIAVFILNTSAAIFTFREQLRLMPIFIPLLVNVAFVITIYQSRSYFMQNHTNISR